MIGYLNGKVLSVDENTVILNVNGVGYEIACSGTLLSRLIRDGEGETFVYTAVREDGIFLYGLNTKEEKKLFLDLITVNGLGPKMGITVLSQMSVNDLIGAISTSDVKKLCTVKGLGKKTAERIILELGEKLVVDGMQSAESTSILSSKKANQDAVDALMSLGFKKTESENAVIKAQDAGLESLQQIIAYAIKNVK
jgi:Holliday junction DNA helicase RuvA